MNDYWPYNPDAWNPDDPYSILDMGPPAYHPREGYAYKPVHDQVFELTAPMTDAQVYNRASFASPDPSGWSNDRLAQADPMLRAMLAELVSGAIAPRSEDEDEELDTSFAARLERERGGDEAAATSPPRGQTRDAYAAYNALNSAEFEQRLRDQTGRTGWDEIAEWGDLGMMRAMAEGADGQALDDAAVDFYQRELERELFGAMPSMERNLQDLDLVGQRFDGRPYSGAGQPYPGPDPRGNVGDGPGAVDPYETPTNARQSAVKMGQSDKPDGIYYDGPAGFQRRVVRDGIEYHVPDHAASFDDPNRNQVYNRERREIDMVKHRRERDERKEREARQAEAWARETERVLNSPDRQRASASYEMYHPNTYEAAMGQSQPGAATAQAQPGGPSFLMSSIDLLKQQLTDRYARQQPFARQMQTLRPGSSPSRGMPLSLRDQISAARHR